MEESRVHGNWIHLRIAIAADDNNICVIRVVITHFKASQSNDSMGLDCARLIFLELNLVSYTRRASIRLIRSHSPMKLF